jgi:hypothetical protein
MPGRHGLVCGNNVERGCLLMAQHDLKEGILSQTYTSACDNAQEVRNPLGITPTSLGK